MTMDATIYKLLLGSVPIILMVIAYFAKEFLKYIKGLSLDIKDLGSDVNSIKILIKETITKHDGLHQEHKLLKERVDKHEDLIYELQKKKYAN